MRTYRCVDCPPTAPAYPGPARGRLPARCPVHADRYRLRQDGAKRRRKALRVVAPDEAVAEPPQVVPEQQQPEAPRADVDDRSGGEQLMTTLRRDLDAVQSVHPAAATLERVAVTLAEILGSPAARESPAVAASLSRELRAVLGDLVEAKQPETDDLFDGGQAGPRAVADG